LQGAWTAAAGRFYELSYHHAQISNPSNLWGNVVTHGTVLINMGEARATFALERRQD